MNVTIQPARLHGEIRAIASKSDVHRLLICAAFADTPTRIFCRETNEDLNATMRCLCALGAAIRRESDCFFVVPGQAPDRCRMDCGESGSTLRFLLPVVCALGVDAELFLRGRLPDRPLEPLWSELLRGGAELEKDGNRIRTGKKLRETDYTLASNVSSQFLSGILFSLPLLGGGTLRLTGALESAGYLDMTIQTLKKFGVAVKRDHDVLTVPPGAYRSSGVFTAEGDWSNAAFWLTADFLCGGTVTCTGLTEDSAQADRQILDCLRTIRAGNAVIRAEDIPDLVPILSVAAALAPGRTVIRGAGRLRLKESDRLAAIRDMLASLGGSAELSEDGLIIDGTQKLRGGTVDSYSDHRIVMAAAVASVGCESPVTILGAEAVRKSYPDFFRDFAALGGIYKEETK